MSRCYQKKKKKTIFWEKILREKSYYVEGRKNQDLWRKKVIIYREQKLYYFEDEVLTFQGKVVVFQEFEEKKSNHNIWYYEEKNRERRHNTMAKCYINNVGVQNWEFFLFHFSKQKLWTMFRSELDVTGYVIGCVLVGNPKKIWP